MKYGNCSTIYPIVQTARIGENFKDFSCLSYTLFLNFSEGYQF